nr:MAG TPA: hypothetical protein [Caudoviricetes sp.]
MTFHHTNLIPLIQMNLCFHMVVANALKASSFRILRKVKTGKF